MKVSDLIEELQLQDPDAEVRLGIQPNYPFQHTISGVTTGADARANHPDEDFDDEDGEGIGDFDGDVPGNTVYILEGRQAGYFSKEAWSR